MDFIFMSEGETPPGQTNRQRYQELVDEVLLAERVGFDAFGTSEQHLAIGTATVSAPEVLYPYLMALTSRIRFISLVTLLPVRMNHAIRVAERVATMDVLSNGRVSSARAAVTPHLPYGRSRLIRAGTSRSGAKASTSSSARSWTTRSISSASTTRFRRGAWCLVRSSGRIRPSP